MNNNFEKLEEAKRFVKDNLEECCRELIEWHDTSILCDGKVREVAKLCSFAGRDALPVAESLIKMAAYERICNV